MYRTKFYPNDGSNVVILAKSRTAREAWDAHRKALNPPFTEEAQRAHDLAFARYKNELPSLPESGLENWTQEEICAMETARENFIKEIDKAFEDARLLIPYYPEFPEQIVTVNARGVIVGYGNNDAKLRKAGKVPPGMS